MTLISVASIKPILVTFIVNLTESSTKTFVTFAVLTTFKLTGATIVDSDVSLNETVSLVVTITVLLYVPVLVALKTNVRTIVFPDSNDELTGDVLLILNTLPS